jgi:hypothetical protein
MLLVACGLAGAIAAIIAHRQVDRTRHEVDIALDLAYVPDGNTLRVAGMGFDEPMADALWIRAVLLFGERWNNDPTASWSPWFVAMLRAVNTLDPRWENPYTYGGMMLRVMGQVDASDEVFERAIRELPDNPFFPFALGMNQYLLRNDAQAAAHWIGVAAELPGAPAWYAAAAAGFLARRNQRPSAIRFLEEELSQTQSPSIRQVLADKLANLVHDEMSEQIARAREVYVARFGHDIQSVEDLRKTGLNLPDDPLGGTWILAPDGQVRSDKREAVESERARQQEWKWLSPR